MLDRHNITSTNDLVAGMGRLDAFLSRRSGPHSETGPTHSPTHEGTPGSAASRDVLEKLELVTGIEPVTPSLRVTCSTS